MAREKLFTNLLEDWFSNHKRYFEWRDSRNPYFIWISEIMSQQTQIQRVADIFFPRFIKAYPTIQDLAQSSWEDVYPVWKGLGYYKRGQNMLKTAKIISEKYNNEFPKEPQELEKLPGIGKYTAAAICAFSFNMKIPAIDTNISKIIQVLWAHNSVFQKAQELVDFSSSGFIWNSAMMDLATQLRLGNEIKGSLGKEFFPKSVVQKFIPIKNKKSKNNVAEQKKKLPKNTKIIEVGIACIWENGKYLIQARPKGKSFEGSWEFPGGKREKGESFRDCVKREIEEEVGLSISVRPHFFEELLYFPEKRVALQLRFHRCQIQSGTPKSLENQPIDWIKPQDFFSGKFNFLKTNQKALKKLQKMRV